MKHYVSILVLFAILLMAIPSISLAKRPDSLSSSEADVSGGTASLVSSMSSQAADYDPDTFLVLDTSSGQVLSVPAENYVIGAVCAEMPASFNEEALKAQAIAARTYAVRQRERERANPTSELKGAYFSNDSSKYQAFFTDDQMHEYFGDQYTATLEKVTAAVKAVEGEILMYNNEPIVAAFHSMSGGMTESAQVIWGTALDYLVPVKSEEDVDSPEFLQETPFTSAELSARLTSKFPGIVLGENKAEWLTILERSSSGTITKLQAGDQEMSGMDLRTLLSLRSSNFDISYSSDKDQFTLTTKGYGHGVGLSQYGANAMAAAGKTYEEILKHYYQGVEIVKE